MIRLILPLLIFAVSHALASDLDEFKVKRQEMFEFTEKPGITREGDKITITFASKAFCDATVAIEDAQGKIVRHLASGVLGPNAPEPFQKTSLRQSLVWDSKNDKGEYVDDKDSLTVRVSLGLKAQFERTLYWSPKKMGSWGIEAICAAKEGVYVYQHHGLRPGYAPKLYLFDHDGNYVRTVYPFPRSQLANVKGLQWRAFPPGEEKFPLKWGTGESSLLTLGNLAFGTGWPNGGGQSEIVPEGRVPVVSMAVMNGRVYLFEDRLNRLSLAESAVVALDGPRVSLPMSMAGLPWATTPETPLVPPSVAGSPDGRWLYLAGYYYIHYTSGGANGTGIHGVFRMDPEKDAEPQLFLGRQNKSHDQFLKELDKDSAGSDNEHFKVPTSVDCDAQGRLYVSDYVNDRIQVFSPDGKYQKTIPIKKPSKVIVHRETGELYVFSWWIPMFLWERAREEAYTLPATLTHLGPLNKPDVLGSYPLPVSRGFEAANGFESLAEIDFHVKPFRLWFIDRTRVDYRAGDYWNYRNIRVFELRDGKLALVDDFHEDVKKSVVQQRPPRYGRWRVYCDPRNGHVYVAEHVSPTVVADVSSFDELVHVNPDTGKIDMVQLPFDTDDMMFDVDGHAYLRSMQVVARYDPTNWREVPFDYGEELHGVYHYVGHSANLHSGLVHAGGQWASPITIGMGVSPKGNLAVGYILPGANVPMTEEGDPRPRKMYQAAVKPYAPRIYPGRASLAAIHVYDKHGKLLHEDALPGIGMTSGVKIDNDDNLYVLANGRRNCGGKPYPDLLAGTLFKARAGKTKILSDGSGDSSGGSNAGGIPIPLNPTDYPKRPPDMLLCTKFGGRAWVEGADWFYGGVGANSSPRSCHCAFTGTFALDDFRRSFVPENHRYDVVAIDSAGNTMLRIGKYGNVDDGLPLVKPAATAGPTGAVPPNPRSIGGDEVGLVAAYWVATHTDRRLFISDIGNYRIVSVKLGYHAEEKVALKGMPDGRP